MNLVTNTQTKSPTTRKLPAYRLTAGDIVIVNRRRLIVRGVQQVVFYSRNRLRPLPETERNGVQVFFVGRLGTETFKNFDLVTVKAR